MATVDLRPFIPDGEQSVAVNLSSSFNVLLENLSGESFETTLHRITEIMQFMLGVSTYRNVLSLVAHYYTSDVKETDVIRVLDDITADFANATKRGSCKKTSFRNV
ncbi:MAG: hypothetical protein GX434_01005 [Peptococcaceae bacterium]|nr:hypothetical protein [Peptococcaceae bacterium]